MIVSNETVQERNIAFSCCNKLIEIIRIQGYKQFIFGVVDVLDNLTLNLYSLLYVFIPVTPKFIETIMKHAIKRKMFQDLTTGKVIIWDVSFANNVKVVYFGKSEIISHDLGDVMYTHGTLKVRHVKRSTNAKLDFSLNSPIYMKQENL